MLYNKWDDPSKGGLCGSTTDANSFHFSLMLSGTFLQCSRALLWTSRAFTCADVLLKVWRSRTRQ